MAEQIRRGSTWAAVLGVAGLLISSLIAPYAAYRGHQCLRRILQENIGFEHRGAALVGAILGWLGSAYLLVALLAEAKSVFEP